MILRSYFSEEDYIFAKRRRGIQNCRSEFDQHEDNKISSTVRKPVVIQE